MCQTARGRQSWPSRSPQRTFAHRGDPRRPTMTAGMIESFEAAEVHTGEVSIFACRSGSGPPILLLHGFPETHLMWRGVAPLLARRFTVICADLRGYGQSGCPAS